MKTKSVLLTAMATIGLFAAITGCRKSDDNWYYGNISFWNIDVNEDIDVTVDNRYTSTITALYNPAYCNDISSANFYLQEGYHTYYAESRNTHVYWSGSFYIESDCKLLELRR